VAVQVYKHQTDVPLSEAMIVLTRGKRVGVVPHPDRIGLSDQFSSSVGACFAYWREMSEIERKLQLMIEVHQIAACYDIPAEAVHQALLCIPEYRNMLARDCLPSEYQHERD